MSNYKIGIYKGKNGRIIDLTNITDIKKLKNLDKLTSSFKNEGELKLYLFNQGLIETDEIDQKIYITYKYNKKIKKIPVVYQDSKKYFDVFYLRSRILSLKSNTEFLEKLANHYSTAPGTYNRQLLNVQDIRLYISDVRSNNGNLFSPEALEIVLNDLVEKAVFKFINRQSGEVKEDYRGLRDLALFVYDFDKKLEKEKKDEKETDFEQISIFNIVEENEKIEDKELSPYPKNYNLGPDDEPLFPPNSEELEMYKRYLDKLNEFNDYGDDLKGTKKR